MCAMMLSVAAFAQKGESAVGINLNATPCLESGASLTNFGIAAKYQYNFTDPIRVEAVLGYDFKAKGVSVFEVGVNGHWLFNIGSKIKVYPIVGLGYANVKGLFSVGDIEFDDDYDYDYIKKYSDCASRSYDDDDEDIDISDSSSKFYFNVGVGGEYAITDHLSACLEVKYQGISHFNRLPITIGVAYKF